MDSPGVQSTLADSVTASRTLSFWENVQLRRLVLSFFLTPAATYAVYFASIAVVEQETHSSAQMGLMILSSTLPGFLFAVLAGVVVDRQNRVSVLVIGNVLRVFVVIGFAAATHWAPNLALLLGTVYASNFLLSALLQFTVAAEGALIPNVVASKQLLGANSLSQIVKLGGQGAGVALLAPALLQLGGAPAVGVAAIPLLVLSTWVCARLPAELGGNSEVESSTTWSSPWQDLRVGWRFLAHHASVRLAIGCIALVSALQFVILTLAPGLAARLWEIPTQYVSYLAVPGGLGFGLGVWLLGRHGDRVGEERWIVRGFLALSGGLAFLPALRTVRGPQFFLFLLISVAAAGGFAMILIPSQALIQERSPDEARGRVSSAQLFLSNIASTLPLPLIGGLADIVGFRPVLACLALVSLGAGVAVLRRAGRESGEGQTR